MPAQARGAGSSQRNCQELFTWRQQRLLAAPHPLCPARWRRRRLLLANAPLAHAAVEVFSICRICRGTSLMAYGMFDSKFDHEPYIGSILQVYG